MEGNQIMYLVLGIVMGVIAIAHGVLAVMGEKLRREANVIRRDCERLGIIPSPFMADWFTVLFPGFFFIIWGGVSLLGWLGFAGVVR